MSDYEPYIKYVKIPVNGGRGCYLLTPEYFATCTISQFRFILKEIRYNKYLFSDEYEVNELFSFIQQGIVKEKMLYNNYSGYVTKKKNIERKLEILSEERRTYYDV